LGWACPLCLALSIDAVAGKKCADCLSDSEFPRALATAATHRMKRDTVVFFWQDISKPLP